MDLERLGGVGDSFRIWPQCSQRKVFGFSHHLQGARCGRTIHLQTPQGLAGVGGGAGVVSAKSRCSVNAPH